MLKLCLYGPCTNFNLATATWETNILQNCRGLVAEKLAITRGLCLKHTHTHLEKQEWQCPVTYKITHLGLVDFFFILIMSSQKNHHIGKKPTKPPKPEG